MIPLAIVDPSYFAIFVSFILGGGLASAIRNYRKAGPEAESIAVVTLRGVLEEMRSELTRKDSQIAEQNKTIGQLAHRVRELELKLDNPDPEFA